MSINFPHAEIGVKLVKEYCPEMVFLDLGIPGMDGYEVVCRLRGQTGLEKVRLAALTGGGQPEDRRRTKEAGFDHYLVKLVKPRSLRRCLAAVMGILPCGDVFWDGA